MQAGSRFQASMTLIFLCMAAAVLCSCSVTSSSSTASLAPAPPRAYPVIIQRVAQYSPQPVMLSQIEAASGPIAPAPETILALETQKLPKGCRVKDRFDRKYLVAYQWGRAGESKLGLDIDGIGFDGGEFEGVMLEYKLRLQPIPDKKDACRRASNWQGMLGTGYHELFVREEDTVWQHLDEFSDEWADKLDTLLDD